VKNPIGDDDDDGHASTAKVMKRKTMKKTARGVDVDVDVDWSGGVLWDGGGAPLPCSKSGGSSPVPTVPPDA